jgi:hypothetical protein
MLGILVHLGGVSITPAKNVSAGLNDHQLEAKADAQNWDGAGARIVDGRDLAKSPTVTKSAWNNQTTTVQYEHLHASAKLYFEAFRVFQALSKRPLSPPIQLIIHL